MRIRSLAYALPSQLVTNEQLVERIIAKNHSALAPSELDAVGCYLKTQLQRTGANTRYHRTDDEKALQLGLMAGQRALEAADLEPEAIDLLIYTGVGRGFVEPATANVFQSGLRLVKATCFDVLDACAGWLRALDLAHHLIGAGTHRYAMLLNCETNFREYEPSQISSRDEAELLWPGLTVGEVATATVITASDEHAQYRTTFRNAGALACDCQIPLPHAAEFQNGRAETALPPLQFYARPEALARGAVKLLSQQFWGDPVLPALKYDAVFGHSVSVPVSRTLLRVLKLDPSRYFDIFPTYGNVVSASLPLAISLAQREGRLKRGDRVLLVMGGGGLTTALSTFVF